MEPVRAGSARASNNKGVLTMATGARDGFTEVQGLKMHYWEWGDRGNPDVLLVHGWTGFGKTWAGVAESLADRYHVVAPDHQGVVGVAARQMDLHLARALDHVVIGYHIAVRPNDEARSGALLVEGGEKPPDLGLDRDGGHPGPDLVYDVGDGRQRFEGGGWTRLAAGRRSRRHDHFLDNDYRGGRGLGGRRGIRCRAAGQGEGGQKNGEQTGAGGTGVTLSPPSQARRRAI